MIEKLGKPKLILAAIITMAVSLRIALPYATVLGGEYIKFIEPDAYYHMGIITKMALVFPVSIHQYQLWDWLVAGLAWLLAGGNPTKEFVEHVAVFMPPVLAGLIVFFVYIMGSRLFNPWAGLIAAVVIAFIPGDFWYRSLLGAVDHHIAEVFFTTAVMMFIVLVIRTVTWRRWLYIIPAALCLISYVYTWQGYPLFIVILAGGGLAAWVLWVFKRYDVLVSIPATVASIGLCILLAAESGIIDKIIAGFSMDPLTLATTSEAISAFSMVGLFGLVLPKCLLALVLLVPLWRYKQAGHLRWLLVVWVIACVAATFWQRRFDYYLVVPLSLLMGFVVWRAYDAVVKSGQVTKRFCQVVFTAFASIIVVGFLIVGVPVAVTCPYAPSDDWQESLIWVRDNTPEDSLIISWWDYGYWIEYIAEREAFVDNSQNPADIKQAAGILLTGEGLPEASCLYLVLDDDLVSSKMGVVAIWAGKDNYSDSFATRLYKSHSGIGSYSLAQKNLTVKVYKENDV